MKNSLNEMVQKIVKRTEETVRKETPLDVEFIIVTDVTLIPTSCSYFMPKESQVERTLVSSGFLKPSFTL